MRKTARRLIPATLIAGLALSGWLPLPAAGHEIPTDVTVQIIVRPSGDRLDLLVRAPLEAMQDIDFPTFGPGYLDVPRAERQLRDAATLWLTNDIEVFENGIALGRPRLVAARASIPSDRSFAAGYETARAHVLGEPLPGGTQLVWQQALLDVLLELPIASASSAFALHPRLERLGLDVTTVVRFAPPNGPDRIFRLDDQAEPVELDPRWHQASLRFVRAGFEHILDGTDHLLFLFCLVLPFRRELKSLIVIVTAFTVAHSVTLIGSAYGLAPNALWFTPLVETLIAASIFYMAAENVLTEGARMRWLVAFGFGLVHGFGFSFALRNTLQFAGDHVLMALVSFNVGVELGQLLVLLLLIPALNFLFRRVPSERIAIAFASIVVAHIAWHWMAERYEILSAFPI